MNLASRCFSARRGRLARSIPPSIHCVASVAYEIGVTGFHARARVVLVAFV